MGGNMGYRIYEPTPDRKSWYGKCAVYEREDGEKALRSYKTIVMTIDADGIPHRHWDKWSATTARHIWAAFCVDTKDYRAMDVERLPRKWRNLEATF